MDRAVIEVCVHDMLKAFGEDPSREGLRDTPTRVAKAYEELLSSYDTPEAEALAALATTFTECAEEDDMGNKFGDIVIVKDIEFSSYCQPGKAGVSTPNGGKCINRVEIGDELWALDENGIVRKTKVISKKSRKAAGYLKVRCRAGMNRRRGISTALLTPEHPIMTESGWKEAGDLRVGDLVEYINPKTLCKEQFEMKDGYALGYLLGAVASDGAIQYGGHLKLGANSREFVQKCADCCYEAFGKTHSVSEVLTPSGFRDEDIKQYLWRIVSSDITKKVMKILGLPLDLGVKSKTFKFKFPRYVLKSREMFQGFLEGYRDGDGKYLVKKRVSNHSIIRSSNLSFIEEFSSLFGVDLHVVEPAGVTLERSPNSKTTYWIHLYDDQIERVWKSTNAFAHIVKEVDFRESVFSEVVSIECVDTPTKVFSIQCFPFPNYVSNGYNLHNCEHHIIPFVGTATVGYIPGELMIGISKIARIVDYYARRLQVQERMTHQIGTAINKLLDPVGVAVIIEARHLCMGARGVRKPGASTITSYMSGSFKQDAASRNEFLQLIRR